MVQQDDYNYLGSLGTHCWEVQQRPPGGARCLSERKAKDKLKEWLRDREQCRENSSFKGLEVRNLLRVDERELERHKEEHGERLERKV